MLYLVTFSWINVFGPMSFHWLQGMPFWASLVIWLKIRMLLALVFHSDFEEEQFLFFFKIRMKDQGKYDA
jgi:uncharacterized protein (DUF983 family)